MSNKHGAISPIRPRDLYHDDLTASALYGIDMSIEENVNAGFFAVIDSIPELLNQFRSIRYADD